jgi:hypothetical protein
VTVIRRWRLNQVSKLSKQFNCHFFDDDEPKNTDRDHLCISVSYDDDRCVYIINSKMLKHADLDDNHLDAPPIVRELALRAIGHDALLDTVESFPVVELDL